MGTNPYVNLDDRSFWKPAVAANNPLGISGLWKPKYDIQPTMAVVTYGSCFAQHIGRALEQRGYNWLVSEAGPNGLPPELLKRYNYNVFSSRTGNIYTTSLLHQWCQWATGERAVPDEVWIREGRYIDPFRPNIEPEGFESADEMVRSRDAAIEAFKRSIQNCEVFVFTLGLTESWFNRSGGYEYPMCPGTAAGEYDEDKHVFINQDYVSVLEHLDKSIALIRRLNPKVRLLLTVSPVPLVATNSGDHVLVATMHSKSVLRAVAGQKAKDSDFIDYFPSYEIINSPAFKGMFFEPNARGVHKAGVEFVMSHFFAGQQGEGGTRGPAPSLSTEPMEEADNELVCEEEMLAAFGSGDRL